MDAASDLERRGIPLVVRLGPARRSHGGPWPRRSGPGWSSATRIPYGSRNNGGIASHRHLKVPFYLVNGDVVVPSSLFPLEEYAAHGRYVPGSIVSWPSISGHGPNPKAHMSHGRAAAGSGVAIDPTALLGQLKVGGSAEVPGYRGGSKEAWDRLHRFICDRLPRYATERNQPTPYFTSELSAHLHFGHISPLTIATGRPRAATPRESASTPTSKS